MKKEERRFSESQQAAIDHQEGPILVIAGPGAGKTTVMTQRLKRMVEKDRIDPERILVITFTRAAAREMEERYKTLTKRADTIRFGTFHSVFLEWLKHWKLFRDQEVLTEKEKNDIMVPFFQEMTGMQEEEAKEQADLFLAEYDRYRNEGRNLKEVSAFSCCKRDIFQKAAVHYREEKKKAKKVDYEDMQQLLWETLQKEPDKLQEVQQQYRYFLIDEFQDINPIQYKILQKFSETSRNIFVVGDEDQSIYGFRGSAPEFLLRFPSEYPDCRVIVLEENYRCRSSIVALSQKLICHNRLRYEKRLKAVREGEEKIPILYWPTPEEEAIGIRDGLEVLHRKKKIAYDDMAVLYRTNQRSRLIRKALSDGNIPFQSKEGSENWTEHWIVKDMQYYWRLRENPEDPEAFLYTARQMGIPGFMREETVRGGGDLMQGLTELPQLTAEQREKAEEFRYHWKRMRKQDLADSMIYLWKHTEYKGRIRQYEKKQFLSRCQLETIGQRLWEQVKDCHTMEEWEIKRSRTPLQKGEGVHLSTMHGAKGLEFSLVWCAAVSKGILPHIQGENIEEERRILYVGLTRAKDVLVVSGFGDSQSPSQFITELKE